jgi:polyferredoxin
MSNNWMTRQVKGLIDDAVSYLLLTLFIFLVFAGNYYLYTIMPVGLFWGAFLIESILFYYWITWATGPAAIRDRTEEFEQQFGPQPHDKQWADFDATMKRWEENEKKRGYYDNE